MGACSLEEIDHNFMRADFGIYLGRRRGEGIGSDAVRLTLDWAFHIPRPAQRDARDLRLQRRCRTRLRARRLSGIGRRRDAVLALGARRDSILMGATIADFDSPVLARLRPAP